MRDIACDIVREKLALVELHRVRFHVRDIARGLFLVRDSVGRKANFLAYEITRARDVVTMRMLVTLPLSVQVECGDSFL